MADILFINAMGSLTLSQEVNGTLLLATKLLQAGFDTEVLRFCQIESYNKDYPAFIRDITDRVLEMAPKCVSFYTLWPDYHIMLRIARELKARSPETLLILGGPQASATAKDAMEALPYIDYISTGEGENTVVPFFECLLRKGGQGLDTIPGLYYREQGKTVFHNLELPLCDLNTQPHWDDRLYLPLHDTEDPALRSRYYFMPIDAGRGCPYNCTFCCTSYFWRRTYRLKTPERIVEDIRFFYDKFGIRSFWFSHDAFTINRALVTRVCDHILEQGLDITWRCSARVDCITEDLVLKMKEAGMKEIELGIETGSKRMQKLTNKNLDLERAKDMIAFLLKNKIHVALFFMYGFPEETEEDLNQTLELMFTLRDMGVHDTTMAFCSFNPATAITEKNFDRLVLDPEIKILSRRIFGYQEELPVIRDNKALFPCFYHLDTPVRNEFQYLVYLTHLYHQFPAAARYLRGLYKGDNLRFYRDFYRNNISCFQEDMAYAAEQVIGHPVQMLENTIQDFDEPYIRQLKGLLRFDYDAHQVAKSPEDTALRRTYDFCYLDFKRKLPIEQYSQGKTEILLEKKNGKTGMKILKIT